MRVGKDGFQELQRNNLHAVIFHFVYAGHTDILDDTQVCEVFLAKRHPEACTLDGGEILHQRLQFFVIKQVGVAWTDVRISQVFVDFQRLGCHPFSVFIIAAVLCNLTDVDFRIEVGGECFMMISGITVYDVQILYFVKMMFGGVCRIYAAYSRVETAAEDGGQSGIFEAFLIGPLPTVFKVGNIFRLIIGGIQIVDSALQASLHDGEVLVGEGYVDDDFGFETIEECYQFVHAVGIYLGGFDVRVTDCLDNSVTFGLGAAGYHDFCKHIRILSHFVRNNGTYTACTDNKNFTHFFVLYIILSL